LSDPMIHDEVVNHTWTYPWPTGSNLLYKDSCGLASVGHYDNGVSVLQFYIWAIHQRKASHQASGLNQVQREMRFLRSFKCRVDLDMC
jgi:hypothetical protein